MRAGRKWCVGAVLALAACGGSAGGDESGGEGDAPRISIIDVAVGDGGEAVLEYAFADDGPVRVQIDWGDGSALQGFTGEGGTFTSRHVYDAMVTSVVVTVITTDADGNTSATTRTVDLVGSAASEPSATTAPSTTPPDTEPPASSVSATTELPASTTPTTTAPAPPPRPTTTPPPPPRPTTTTTTATTTTTTTTTLPPRQFRVVVRGNQIRVVGDCDSIGGQGDFVIAGELDAGTADRFSFGTRSNTVQLGDGATLDLSGERSVSSATDEGSNVDWSVGFVVSEVDVGGNDPNMNARTASDSGVVGAVRDAQTRTISVGSGSCRVDLTFTVSTELA